MERNSSVGSCSELPFICGRTLTPEFFNLLRSSGFLNPILWTVLYGRWNIVPICVDQGVSKGPTAEPN